jgi:hypothetical protein
LSRSIRIQVPKARDRPNGDHKIDNYWSVKPTCKKITREVIAAIPDDQLAQAMFDYIWHKKTRQVVANLSLGFRAIYHLFALDGEIGNGGFNQYFFNRLDRDAEQQLEALELIQATKHQRIFRKAFKMHDKEKQNEELQRRYAERTIESFFSTYGMTKLDECDRAWYALDKEFDVLRVKFIRRHPELFVTEEQEPRKDKKRRPASKGKVGSQKRNRV